MLHMLTVKGGNFFMKKILVSGLINIETTISGVAYNVASSLKILGATPHLLSIIGSDIYQDVIINKLKSQNISFDLFPLIDSTPQSVVLYDEVGNRRICLDLKNIQEINYPIDEIQPALMDIELAIVCNINFSRDLLKMLKSRGVCIATDVHVVDSVEDSFNKDFMEFADILFLSNEHLVGRERDFLDQLINKFQNKIIVIGMGCKGALMYERLNNKISMHSPVHTRKIVNTIGAGDALFSSFVFFYNKTKNPYISMENAMYFASYKIGEKGAANGFLSEQDLEKIKNLS